MSKKTSTYSIGDWVVHHAYGIGQIKKVEVKPIHGKHVPCFKVRTNDSEFWFPKNRSNNPRIRPVVTPKIVQRAKRELLTTVPELDPDRTVWKKRIDEVKSDYDFIAICQLVRDLTILRTQRKLNQTEENALSHFTDRLLREWSATMNTDLKNSRQKLDNYLLACREQANASNS
jgi:RNA polymerase-interacting CarD/CdnL/TRCF family regulator